jgi:hypothetical protein
VESHDSGSFSIWSKEDVPMARPMGEGLKLPALQRWTWGLAPLALSFAAVFLAAIWRDRRTPGDVGALPANEQLREVD